MEGLWLLVSGFSLLSVLFPDGSNNMSAVRYAVSFQTHTLTQLLLLGFSVLCGFERV